MRKNTVKHFRRLKARIKAGTLSTLSVIWLRAKMKRKRHSAKTTLPKVRKSLISFSSSGSY